MPTQIAALNDDPNGRLTSAYYGDRGDGTSNWYNASRIFNGGDVAKGSTTDAAVTDPTSTAGIVSLLKGLLTFLRISAAGLGKAEDAAHSSGDTGVMTLGVRRDTAAVSSGTTGDYEPLQMDSTGRLRVRTRGDEVDLSNARTTALAASLVAKASAGKLFGFQGYSTSAGFVQVHNTTSVPADTAVPAEVIPVEADKPFSFDAGPRGIAFGTGITLVFSSTGPTKTIGSSVMWVSVQYE